MGNNNRNKPPYPGKRNNQRPSRLFGDDPNSWVITWIFYAFVIFWPQLLSHKYQEPVQIGWGSFLAVIWIIFIFTTKRNRS